MNRLAQILKMTPLALALTPALSWADSSVSNISSNTSNSAGASMDSNAATNAAIAELKARLAQLEQEVKAANAKAAAVATQTAAANASTTAPAATAARPVASASSTGFTVGDTSVKYSGYIKLDAMSSSFSEGEVGRVTGRDFYVPNAVPVFGGGGSGITAGANGKSRNFFDAHAKQSRFMLDTDTPTDGGPSVKTHIEMDFQSSAQGNENVTNGYSPELRQAYMSYGHWMAGQAWTTFQDLGALPETLDYVGASDGTVFGRQAQLRYTSGPWQFAAENSQTVVSTANTSTTAISNASAVGIDTNDNILPDMVARYTQQGEFGYVSLAALGRQLKNKAPLTAASGANTANDSAIGYGISLSGKIKAIGQDDIRFMLTHGNGIGRYLALNTANDAVATNQGRLDPIGVTAGYVTYHHLWTEKLRSNIQVSAFHADNPLTATADATRNVQSGLVNLIYTVVPKLDVGMEFMHASRSVKGGASGDLDRLQFSVKKAF